MESISRQQITNIRFDEVTTFSYSQNLTWSVYTFSMFSFEIQHRTNCDDKWLLSLASFQLIVFTQTIRRWRWKNVINTAQNWTLFKCSSFQFSFMDLFNFQNFSQTLLSPLITVLSRKQGRLRDKTVDACHSSSKISHIFYSISLLAVLPIRNRRSFLNTTVKKVIERR